MSIGTKSRIMWSFFGASVVTCSVALALPFLGGSGSINGAVTIDPVQIVNAERAVASSLFQSKGADDSNAIVSINRFGSQVNATINQVAHGRLVLVKQAVVSGNLPDITDEVLAELGLPKGAPTIDMNKTLEMAPTSSYQLMGNKIAKDAAENSNQMLKSFINQSKKNATNELP